MKPSQVLREARALLEPRGAWIQHLLYSRDHARHCALGAVRHALDLNERAGSERADVAVQYLRRCIRNPVSLWNDHPSRRKGQVLAAFDRAIALAESESQ